VSDVYRTDNVVVFQRDGEDCRPILLARRRRRRAVGPGHVLGGGKSRQRQNTDEDAHGERNRGNGGSDHGRLPLRRPPAAARPWARSPPWPARRAARTWPPPTRRR